MRVITGSARGRKLKTLEGNDVRPTTDKVKEAVFSVLQFDIEGRRVLDLFAGSGQLGIEALSRAAASAVFVDCSKRSIAVVNDNLASTSLAENARVVMSDSIGFLSACRDEFDIVFLDPPYATGLLQSALAKVGSVMSDYAVAVCEHPTDEKLPDSAPGLTLAKRYKYGKTTVSVYRKDGQ